MPIKTQIFKVHLTGSFEILIPEEHAQPFVNKGRDRVRIEARHEDKTHSIYAALRNRNEAYRIMFGKRNQQELGIDEDSTFTLQLFEDTSKYGVEMPKEMEAVLMTDFEAYELFEGLSMGFKRSLIYAIARYKGSQTRIDKTLVLCENLKRGIRERNDMLRD